MRSITDLHAALTASGLLVDGVALLDADKKIVRIDFQPGSPNQEKRAQAIVDAFDWSDEAAKKAAAVTSVDTDATLKALLATLQAKNPDLKMPTLADVRAAVVNAIHAGQAD